MSAGIGKCLECGQNNSYVATACWACGARLPWAEASERAIDASAQGNFQAPVSEGTPSNEAAAPVGRTPYTPPVATSTNLAAATPDYHCCGLRIDGDMNFCPKCGRSLKAPQQWSEAPSWMAPIVREPAELSQQKVVDKPSLLHMAVSFIFPFIGIIIFFMLRGKTPVKARTALFAALVSVAFNIIYYIVTGIDPATIFAPK